SSPAFERSENPGLKVKKGLKRNEILIPRVVAMLQPWAEISQRLGVIKLSKNGNQSLIKRKSGRPEQASAEFEDRSRTGAGARREQSLAETLAARHRGCAGTCGTRLRVSLFEH